MNIFEDFFSGNSEQSRHYNPKDVNPCYVYLMQTRDDEIMAAYKVPYNQASNGGLRFNDFISDSIGEEQENPVIPDYIFRSYYVPCGSVLPEINRDNLQTIWALLDQKGFGILDRVIPFKDAVFALNCKQSFFRSDGTPFSAVQYDLKGWNEFLERDTRRYIADQFNSTLKAAMQECQNTNIGKFRKQELISAFNRIISRANEFKGLVPKLYDTLQGIGRNNEKRKISEILQRWTFPAFFTTNFASNKWTDKHMLQFIGDTGMDYIQFLDNKDIKQFLDRQNLTGLVDKYYQAITEARETILAGTGNGQLIYEKARTTIGNQIRLCCAQRLNGVSKLGETVNSGVKENLPFKIKY